jgi:hypothetical protein
MSLLVVPRRLIDTLKCIVKHNEVDGLANGFLDNRKLAVLWQSERGFDLKTRRLMLFLICEKFKMWIHWSEIIQGCHNLEITTDTQFDANKGFTFLPCTLADDKGPVLRRKNKSKLVTELCFFARPFILSSLFCRDVINVLTKLVGSTDFPTVTIDRLVAQG